MPGIKQIVLATSVDDPKTSQSISGKIYPNFETLDAETATARRRIIINSNFNREISIEEQKAQKEDRYLRGRQIACKIYDYFRVIGTHETILDFSDLVGVTPRQDYLQGFDTKCVEILFSIRDLPQGNVLESSYKLRIRESDQFKTVLALCEQDIEQKGIAPKEVLGPKDEDSKL